MKRVLIKLSGEGLANKEKSLDIDPELINDLARQLKVLLDKKYQIGIVVGGGNFWRGASAEKNGIPRNRADYIGMLATVMNGMAIQAMLEKNGIKSRVMSSLSVDKRAAESYINEIAVSKLEKGEVVIFAGGTGRPYFTTDTTSALVASEINADIILMGKNGVDGIYDSDPKTNPNAVKFEKLTYDELLAKDLKVMDATAAAMARDNNIQLIVFNINEENSIERAAAGDIPHSEVVK